MPVSTSRNGATSHQPAPVSWNGSYARCGPERLGLALSGFLRIVTHPRVFIRPSPPDEALQFTNVIRSQPQCVPISPGPRHWEIFTRLYRDAETMGNLIPDAYFAALAIESGCEWITLDRDFARFEGLRWRRPTCEPS
ncbi:MAG: type II toxin-antitoxin system VapC family toxin [Nitrospira sp. SB0677_bin_15]|nr:type II toxin-antitoxin system VapC family toxin [Nitrospira sp. SB0677_bin_15]